MSIRLFRSFRLWSNLRPTFAATSEPTINAAGSRLAGTRLGARASLRCAEALLFVIGAVCPMAAAQTAHFSGARSKIVDRSQFPGANRDADLADSGRNQVHREQTGSATDFGAVDVGTTSAAMTLTFTFDASATLGSTSVLTQGVPNLDFADSGTGTCKAGTAYNSGATCTVDVTFTPTLVGTRYGAAVLNDNSGNAIATGYVHGTGSGPQVNFPPGTENTIGNDVDMPGGLVVDGSGDVYISDSVNNHVLKETPTAGGYTQSILFTGLNTPGGLAVDGAGNIYLTDDYNDRVLKETPSASGYTQSTVGLSLIHI